MRGHWFFDFDGTLFDTCEDIKLGWLQTLKELGEDCPKFHERYITGPSLEDMVGILFPEYSQETQAKLVVAIRANFGRIYDSSGFPNTKAYPWAIKWIKELKAQGIKLYLATNKRMNPAKLILKMNGLEDFFDGIYTSDMYLGCSNPPPGVPTDKTIRKPQYLAIALKEHSINPNDAVMVGDTKIDISSGKANGMYTIGCPWGYGKEGELDEADEIYAWV